MNTFGLDFLPYLVVESAPVATATFHHPDGPVVLTTGATGPGKEVRANGKVCHTTRPKGTQARAEDRQGVQTQTVNAQEGKVLVVS